MSSNSYALLIGTAAIALALLAVCGIIPEAIARMIPVAVVPFVILRRPKPCAAQGC